MRVALLLGVGLASALRLPSQPPASTSRRAAISGAIAAALPLAASAAKDKGYMTLDQYQNLKKQEAKDEKLYGLFESLRDRAAQTSEFDKLAGEDKWSEVSKLALAWDSNIRQEVLNKANDQLSGDEKNKGSKISKIILEDLKALDKIAKAKSKDEMPGASAALRGHVMDFVALEPQRLADRFGVGDL